MEKNTILAYTKYSDLTGTISIDQAHGKNILHDILEKNGINTDIYQPSSITFKKVPNRQYVEIETTSVKENTSKQTKTHFYDMSCEEFLEFTKQLSFTVSVPSQPTS